MSIEVTEARAGESPANSDIPAPPDRWTPWRWAVAVALATRVAFLTVAWAAAWLLSTGTQGRLTEGFLGMWSRWDGTILLRIAERGYTPQGDPHATAFFPLFPLLVRGFSHLGFSPLVAAMTINTAATIVALAFLYRLAEEELGPGAGRRAALYLALFPTAVFLIAPYTEPLFLAGAIPAFYFARRGRWEWVGLPAAVAMGARFAGVFLLIGLAVEFLRRRDFTAKRAARAAAALAVGALPLLAYALYLSRTRGDAFYFFTDQRLGWGRQYVGLRESFLATWRTWNGGYPTNWIFAWRVEILAALVGVGLAVWAIAKREWGYAAFIAGMMAVLVTSTWYYSIPRMLLSLFPAPLFLAGVTRRSAARHEIALMILAPLATLGVIVFTRGAWFF